MSLSVLESIAVAMFCMAFVFAVLAILYAMVMALSRALGITLNKKAAGRAAAQRSETAAETGSKAGLDKKDECVSSGKLRLVNVDEKTAAMIMAIVSEESHIPLSELRFRSIKAVD